MLTKDIQIEKFKEKYIDGLLKGGVEPTVSDVDYAIQDYYLNHEAGQEYFIIPNADPFTVSDKNSWNKSFRDLAADLDILYGARDILKTSVDNSKSLINSKSSNLISEINILNSRVENIKNSLATDNAFVTKAFNFSNFKNVEFYSNEKTNLPATTSFVDLNHNKVSNVKLSTSKDLIDYSKCTISVKNINELDYDIEGEIENILNFDETDYCAFNIRAAAESSPYVKLNIDFEDPVDISYVEIEFSSISSLIASLELTLVNGSKEFIYDITSNNVAEWNFIKSTVKSLAITLTKPKADYKEEKKANFYMILKNIIMINEKYKSSSTFVSKKISFDTIPDEVILDATDMIYEGTNIKYFIGLDNNNNIINWHLVEKNKPLKLGLLKDKEAILNKSFAEFGKKADGVYYLGSIASHTNGSPIKILPGYQQWFAEELSGGKFVSGYKININDYDKSKVKSVGFIDYENYRYNLKPNSLVVLSTSVNNSAEATSCNYNIKSQNGTTEIVVIANNSVVTSINGNLNIPFINGTNKIIILMFNGGGSNDKISHNLNFKNISENCSCTPEVKQVSLSALKNKTMDNDPRAITILSGGTVYSKVNPFSKCQAITSDIDSSNKNYEDYYRCYIRYKSLPLDLEKKYMQEGNRVINLRVMAMLTSEEESVSPCIKEYNVLVR